MTSIFLDPRRTVVFAGDPVTDCGRQTDPDGLAELWRRYVLDD
jgi:acyl-CoA thioesterase-1